VKSVGEVKVRLASPTVILGPYPEQRMKDAKPDGEFFVWVACRRGSGLSNIH